MYGAHESRRIQVDVARLDDVLDESSRPRLIKVDVEGAELAVLRGAAETIGRARPLVVFEHVLVDPIESERLWRLLCDDIGYRVFDIDGNGPLCLADFLRRLETREIWNWVAHP
jgi:hypothetical protein